MRHEVVAIRYATFAAVSTVINLLAQALGAAVTPIYPLTVSICCGTIAGFAVKYVLDKRWIFYDPYESPDREIWKVLLYGIFSIMTTGIFWTTEVAFWSTWHTPAAKYAGALCGLAGGYALKYYLDRTYIFGGVGA